MGFGYAAGSAVKQAWVEQSGAYTPIDYPDAVYTVASGINDLGQVVGYYSGDNGNNGFVTGRTTTGTPVIPGSNLLLQNTNGALMIDAQMNLVFMPKTRVWMGVPRDPYRHRGPSPDAL